MVSVRADSNWLFIQLGFQDAWCLDLKKKKMNLIPVAFDLHCWLSSFSCPLLSSSSLSSFILFIYFFLGSLLFAAAAEFHISGKSINLLFTCAPPHQQSCWANSASHPSPTHKESSPTVQGTASKQPLHCPYSLTGDLCSFCRNTFLNMIWGLGSKRSHQIYLSWILSCKSIKQLITHKTLFNHFSTNLPTR